MLKKLIYLFKKYESQRVESFLERVRNISFLNREINFFNKNDLEKAQIGYRIDNNQEKFKPSNENNWGESWLVIGRDDLDDPIFVDTSDYYLPVYTAIHGNDYWEPILIAISISDFEDILKKINKLEMRIKSHDLSISYLNKKHIKLLKYIENNNPEVEIEWWEDFLYFEEDEEDDNEEIKLFFEVNKSMNEAIFWKIISVLNWNESGNDELVIKPAVNVLSSMDNTDILLFDDILSEKLYLLDGIEYASNMGEDSYKNDESYFSVDNFLYARCCVISNGEEFYKKVLKTPKMMLKNLEFEALLYIPIEAYKLKNKVKNYDYNPKYNIETFSNKSNWNLS